MSKRQRVSVHYKPITTSTFISVRLMDFYIQFAHYSTIGSRPLSTARRCLVWLNIDHDFPANQLLEAFQIDSQIGQWVKIKKDGGMEKFFHFYNGVPDRGENAIEARKTQSSGTTSKRTRTEVVAIASSSGSSRSSSSSVQPS
jgi:hypothetical protein